MIREMLRILRGIRHQEGRVTSLQRRLFVFFAVVIICIVVAFAASLGIAGVFESGWNKSEAWLDTELVHVRSDIEEDCGRLSLQGTELSEKLNEAITPLLRDNNVSAEMIGENPLLMEGMLRLGMPVLGSMLEKANCSGVFLILNGTASGANISETSSRAGIFLKKTEPNTISALGSDVHYLRGPASIARENGIGLLGQWKMEFDISCVPFFDRIICASTDNSGLELSRLYYWSDRICLKDNYEAAVLLGIPVRDKKGTVYGVCGIEISTLMFKRKYSPENSKFVKAFSNLTRIENGVLRMETGMLAGNSYMNSSKIGEDLEIKNGKGDSSIYIGKKERYSGMHAGVKLYPEDSLYQKEQWAVSLMMPYEDIQKEIKGQNLYLELFLVAVLLASLFAAVFISRHYVEPLVEFFDSVKADGIVRTPKFKYVEINDFIEYLNEMDRQRERERDRLAADLEEKKSEIKHVKEMKYGLEDKKPDLSGYEMFIRNIETLSPAERMVFDLYMEGHTAKEISELLYISINTIKTHNKRIYMKLNVTSRKELMIYVGMMKKG